MLDNPRCPLCCGTTPKTHVRAADSRRYFLCTVCALIFTDPQQRLSEVEERAFYGSHENSIENPGYVAFLNRIVAPMLPLLNKNMRGLDFGCGPGPTLSHMVRQQGIACENYDPLFYPSDLKGPYDFIFATECFEHFYEPGRELEKICSLLGPRGLLAIMTEQWADLEAFSRWYYTKDPTHVCFYHADTVAYICAHFDFELLWQEKRRCFILRRNR